MVKILVLTHYSIFSTQEDFEVDDEGMILLNSIKGPFVPPKGMKGSVGSPGFTGARGYPVSIA